MEAIIVNKLSKRYGSKTAVDEVSFSVNTGEIFGLIGPDGAGKTSIFRMLTTLLLPDGGTAAVDGFDIVRDYAAIRARVGYMPGKFSLYPDLSVEENLNFFAAIFNTTVTENYELIKDIYVQLEPFKDRRAGKLSGGMKQKLALCCALIHRPTVLFLDEPTTGVDPVSRKEFWAMLKQLKAQNITILVSTPYMDEADLCDRIALMQDGKILSVDTPVNITRSYPVSLYAAKADQMYRLLKALRQSTVVAGSYAFGEYAHFTLNGPEAGLKTLKLELENQGLTAIEVIPAEVTIEDSFIHLFISMIMAEQVITTNNLTKRFGDFIAANEITFEVNKGEIFGFLGANGAGKTTAMRMLCGLSIPSSGTATIAGFDVYKQTEQIKRNIGYMSQKFSLYEDLTVVENIRFFGGIYGLTNSQLQTRTQELIDNLGLQKEAKTLVGSLPLGWKQKLSFSVAVLHQPRIVFLDEPTGGVDPVTRRQFWDMIYEAADSGITVFVTTHYMDEAEYCNRVSIMVDGRIKALDTPAALKKSFGVASMDEVFYTLARMAKRSE